MADIDLERKRGGGLGWLWAVLVIIALALILWWAWPEPEPEVVGLEVETADVGVPEEPAVAVGQIPVAAILSDPAAWIGRTVSGEVTVPEVPTDRGFWVESEGQRLFALIIDEPQEEPKDINPGQTLQLDGATVRDPSVLPDIPGDPLDEDTLAIARDQAVFLLVPEEAITIVSAG